LLSLPLPRILPEDSREYARQIEAFRPRRNPSCCAVSGCIGSKTRNIQDVAFSIRETCNLETDRLDSELSMVRFVAWAIPAIGFVGTVRGIGNSLQQAHKAVEGDVSGVVAGLGTSFNSTLVALSLSIVVMLCLHQMQLRQERTVLDTENYLDSHLIRHLQMR
jgi:biopolymer transport protein ExbB/TolQ